MELWSRDLLLGVTMDDDAIVAAVVFAASHQDVSHSSKMPLCTLSLRVSQRNASNYHVLAYEQV